MRWVWAALFLMTVAVGSLLVWQGFGVNDEGPFHRRGGRNTVSSPEGKVLAVFGDAPEFTLTERSGKPLSKNDLAGKPWIADFIFTSCAGQCPLMSLQMKKFQTLFPADTGFRFVSFSVDPDRDTPAVLALYADRYGAEKERWLFLTAEDAPGMPGVSEAVPARGFRPQAGGRAKRGPLTGRKEEINRILKEFFLSPVEEPAMHSIRFILVDPEGKIRGYYDSSDPGSMNQLIHDAKLLTGSP